MDTTGVQLHGVEECTESSNPWNLQTPLTGDNTIFLDLNATEDHGNHIEHGKRLVIDSGEKTRKPKPSMRDEYMGEFESEKHGLPSGWTIHLHLNSLPFFYHRETGVISWTRPYVRRYQAKDHIPPLSAFRCILVYHQKEIDDAAKEIELAKKRREAREQATKVTEEIVEKARKEGKQVVIKKDELHEKMGELSELLQPRPLKKERLDQEMSAPIAQKRARDPADSENSAKSDKRSKTSDESSMETECSRNIETESSSSPNSWINQQIEKSVLAKDQPITDDMVNKLIERNLPQEIAEIQSRIIMLVAAMIKLEKIRKKRSYIQFLHDDDPEKVTPVATQSISTPEPRFSTPLKGKKKKTANPSLNELNPNNKSPITFLQEYCLIILKTWPKYVVEIQEDSTKPFVTTVVINDVEYGSAAYLNKKTSKHLAAAQTLEILCPGLYKAENFKPEDGSLPVYQQQKTSSSSDLNSPTKSDLNVPIDDESILSLDPIQHKTPAVVLQEYCNRFQKEVEWKCEELPHGGEINAMKFKETARIENVITVGFGRSKKEAKQRCCQLLLKQLHPNLRTWNQLVERYVNNRSKDEDTEKDKEKLQVYSQLLERLKAKMRKRFPINEQMNATPWVTRDKTNQTGFPDLS